MLRTGTHANVFNVAPPLGFFQSPKRGQTNSRSLPKRPSSEPSGLSHPASPMGKYAFYRRRASSKPAAPSSRNNRKQGRDSPKVFGLIAAHSNHRSINSKHELMSKYRAFQISAPLAIILFFALCASASTDPYKSIDDPRMEW